MKIKQTSKTLTAISPLLALVLVAACSSRNPDALTGMNLDENLAVMDANASANVDATDVVNADESSSDRSSEVAAAPSSDSVAAEANDSAKLDNDESDSEANVIREGTDEPDDVPNQSQE
jgi:hypothetical protein